MILCCLVVQAAFSQAIRATTSIPKYCKPLETIVKSAINGFSFEKRDLLRSYKEDYDMGGIYYFEEYSTIFLWPGTGNNFIRVSTSDIEDEQTISLISQHQKVNTKEEGYAQLKQFYRELTPCAISPLPMQQTGTRNNLAPIAKTTTYVGMNIMDTVFNLDGIKRRVAVTLGLKQENKSYYAEMQVSLILRDEEVIVPKCQPLNDVIKQLTVNFSGQYGKLISSKDLPIVNDVSVVTTTYKAIKEFPGSNGGWIENEKVKKNGVIKRESWELKSWYSSYSYENALSKFKKIYKQLLGCTIITPAGRQLQLKADYSEPQTMESGNKRGVIDYKTSTDNEVHFLC